MKKTNLSKGDILVGAICLAASLSFWFLMLRSGEWSVAGMYLILVFFVLGGFFLNFIILKIENPIDSLSAEKFKRRLIFGVPIFIIAFVVAIVLGKEELAYLFVVIFAPSFFDNWVRRPINQNNNKNI